MREKPLLALYKMVALICLSTLPFSVIAHPDLLLQTESLDEQIEANPSDTELLLKRGDLSRRHEDYPAAAADFAAARKTRPNNILLDFYQGHLLFDSGDAVAAELHFEKYLKHHPENAKAWNLRGKTNIQLNQPEHAAAYFQLAISNTKSPSPSLYRSQILSLLAIGEGKWDEASQVVDQGLQHFGLEVSLLGLGIDIALANDQPLRAMHYLDTLPDALGKLDQWQTRLQTTSCLASTDSKASAQCLQQARSQLANKVTVFLTD